MEKSNKLYNGIVIFSIISLLIALISVAIVVYQFVSTFGGAFPGAERADWGVLGDFFGGTLGPVLNLVTIALLVASFLFQHQQVKDAKADALDAQQQAKQELRIIQKQGFEQTFFAWLKSYREYISEIRRWDDGLKRERIGHKALQAIWEKHMHSEGLSEAAEEKAIADSDTVNYMLRQAAIDEEFDSDLLYSVYLAAFEKLYKKQSSTVGTMLRTLYRLIKWIDESELDRDEKYAYVAIVRAQLTMCELGFLMVNGLTERGAKFRPLINKYALLDNIERHRFVKILSVQGLPCAYEERAFQSDLARAQL